MILANGMDMVGSGLRITPTRRKVLDDKDTMHALGTVDDRTVPHSGKGFSIT